MNNNVIKKNQDMLIKNFCVAARLKQEDVETQVDRAHVDRFILSLPKHGKLC